MSRLNPVNTSLCLEEICASNYQKLLKLIPNLEAFIDSTCEITQQPGLQISILERSVYTLTVELNQQISQSTELMILPAIKIRIYLDVKLLEVLSDHAHAEVAKVFCDASASRDIMTYKWRLNYFLQKWLDFCLQKRVKSRVEESEPLLNPSYYSVPPLQKPL